VAGRRFRVFAATIALGLVLAIALGAAGFFGGSKAVGASTTLTILSGVVTVRHGSDAFVSGVDGELLNSGDTIRTGPDGRAVLTYFEGSSVTIEPSTEIAIDDASASSDGGTVVAMTQTFGRTWHVVTKLVTGGSKYEVRTPASTASVRGTAFTVDVDTGSTTVTTSEGTVVDQVPDPLITGRTVEVPVRPGEEHRQGRGQPLSPTHRAPEPQRRVTITVGATNSIVVDPAGRSNGVTKDGKLLAQTPGAQVTRDGDNVVITLPDVPDGKLATHVAKRAGNDDEDVDVETEVESKGDTVRVESRTKSTGENKTAGVEIERDASGGTHERVLDPEEAKALPTPHAVTDKIRRTVEPVRRASSARPATTAAPTTAPDGTRPQTPAASPDRRITTPEPRRTDAPSRSPSSGFVPELPELTLGALSTRG
jgi:hypothetical protein